MEKIVDALVGNLKEYVQVDENANGERVYSGTLTQMQVPALFNAVSSFYIKQIINEQSRYNHDVPLGYQKRYFCPKSNGYGRGRCQRIAEKHEGEITFSGKDSQRCSPMKWRYIDFKLKDVGTTRSR